MLSIIVTLSPPCFVSLGLVSTKSGIMIPPPVIIAVPMGRRWISSIIPVVSPSTEAVMAFRSLGFVTFKMIWVLH